MSVPSRTSLRAIAIAAASIGCAALAPAALAGPPAVFNPVVEVATRGHRPGSFLHRRPLLEPSERLRGGHPAQ